MKIRAGKINNNLFMVTVSKVQEKCKSHMRP